MQSPKLKHNLILGSKHFDVMQLNDMQLPKLKLNFISWFKLFDVVQLNENTELATDTKADQTGQLLKHL